MSGNFYSLRYFAATPRRMAAKEEIFLSLFSLRCEERSSELRFWFSLRSQRERSLVAFFQRKQQLALLNINKPDY